MGKIKEAFRKLWDSYKNWLGDVVWYKNWKVWLSVAVVLIVGPFGDSDKLEVEEADGPEVEEVAIEEPEEVEPEEVESEEPEEPEELEDEEPVVLSPDLAVSFLNTQEISNIADVSFNEGLNAVTLLPYDDSMAEAFALVSKGLLSDDYENMVDGLLGLSKSLFDMSEVGLILLNPQNTENMLLWLENGSVMYDATKE